ncbi:MAG: sugar phosphate isomerase/epimerase [Deltaproteobacteria bacterium]|jgi:sugar phosphate isomerase/epimerase|nr:sugar phosphate isomerase/epimerase [Deltaproteobacteria bacterium]
MLALSTSWQSGGTVTAEGMFAALKNLEISGIELSYRISEDFYREMQNPLKRSGLKVVSIHNYFPIPSARSDSKGSGDLFLLSSPQKEERQNAIRFTTRSIEHAGEVGAAAVILHCGFVEMNHEMQMLYQYFISNRIDSEEAQIFLHNKLKERNTRKPKHMDSVLSSLDRLVPVAEKQGVLLGLENRYHYHELPGLDDFRLIFDAFQGAPIGYWHDTGHAHANEALGFIDRSALLQNYADKLIGVHLHDAIGLDDHVPPGSGEIDFTALKPFLKTDTIKVFELKSGIPASEVSEGIRFIREKLSEA